MQLDILSLDDQSCCAVKYEKFHLELQSLSIKQVSYLVVVHFSLVLLIHLASVLEILLVVVNLKILLVLVFVVPIAVVVVIVANIVDSRLVRLLNT